MNIGPIELIFLLAILGLYIWALVVCAMKARWVFFVLGIFFGLFAFIGALLPAQPGSSWETRRAGRM